MFLYLSKKLYHKKLHNNRGEICVCIFQRGKKESEVIKMAKNSKQTSKAVVSKASKVLRDGRYSKTSKSVAGSALAQTKKS